MSRLSRRFHLLFFFIASTLLYFVEVMFPRFSSAAPAAPAAPPVFAYAATATGNIFGFEVSSMGALVGFPGAPIATNIKNPVVVAHPFGQYLYVMQEAFPANFNPAINDEPTRETTSLFVYEVAAKGALTLKRTMNVDADVHQIAPHPKGKLVYLVCKDGDVRVFRVDKARGLISAGRTKAPKGEDISALDVKASQHRSLVQFTPNGEYVYVHWSSYAPADSSEVHSDDEHTIPAESAPTDHVAYSLQRFRVRTDGAWEPAGPKWESLDGSVDNPNGSRKEYDVKEASPRHPGPILFTPNGKIALVYGMTSQLWTYRVGPSGALTLHPQFTLPARRRVRSDEEYPKDTDGAPIEVIDPQGRYIITTDTNQTVRAVFSVPKTNSGPLKRVNAFGSAKNKNNQGAFEAFAAEPTGRYLYALTTDPAKPSGEDAEVKPDAPNALAIWKVSAGPHFTALPRRALFPEKIASLIFVSPNLKTMSK